MRTIAVVNLKGGSGKTTTALNLAWGMSERLPKRGRVLLVDSDPQANASHTMLEGQGAESPTLTEVLLQEADIADAIRPTRNARLDLLPAAGDLADCTVLLEKEIGRENLLRNALASVEKNYAVCIIDGPPQLSLVTVNVLKAVTELIVPVDAGLYSIIGLGRLQDTVDLVRARLDHPELAIVGLVLTRITPTKAAKRLEKDLRDAYGDLVYRSAIPSATHVEEALAEYRTVLEWNPGCVVSEKYSELVEEVMNGRSANKRHGRRAAKAKGAA
jgi:chromosome partitioning protein